MDRRSQSLAGHYSSRRLAHNGRAGKVAALRPALSLEAAVPTIQPLPRVYLDLSIEGIQVSAALIKAWHKKSVSHTVCESGRAHVASVAPK